MRKLRFGAVILAAGTASRMGRQKLLLPLAGKPLLAHILST
ncbi:MAG: NTP transferase domain-containing protein, partial [Sporomusa sp.]